MRELLPVVVVALVLAVVSEKLSIADIKHGGYIKKDQFFSFIMAIVLAVFVGLRQGYNDTTAYTRAYENLPRNFSGIDWTLGSNFGFAFVNRCLKIVGFSTQSFIMFYALITIGVYVWFIKKHSDKFDISVFLFITTGCYTFTMAAIKQCVAVALCMIATDCAIQKKRGRFLFFVFLASTFHPYSLMYLFVPFLRFNPWSAKTYIMIAVFAVIGVGLESLLGTVVDITSMLGEEYSIESFIGDGVNIFRLLVVWVPVVLSFWARKYLCRNDEERTNILVNLTILRAEIMFIALFGTANYFARLANYFCMFELVTLPWLFGFYNRRSRQLLYILMIGCYIAYFYYSNAILYGGFDAMFRRITLFQYLDSII